MWRQLESSDALASLSPSAEKNLIEEAVTAAMQQTESACETLGYSLRERVGSACWQLEQQLCVDLLAQWLGHERERSASFRIVEMEQNQTLQVEGLSLTLRPDRIDEFEDGRRAVMTIKPGRPQGLAGWGSVHKNRNCRYTACLIPKIQGIAFAELPASDPVQFIALGEDLGLVKGDDKSLEQQTRSIAATWPELVAQWEASLQQLAREFMAGRLPSALNPAPAIIAIWHRCVA